MNRRMHKLLLLIVTLALATAPLRGAWAIPDIPATGTESHCAEMQQAMADMQQPATGADHSAHDCKQDCGGACCDDSCNACAQGTSAISSTTTVMPDITGTLQNMVIPVSFYKRTIIPLLQPPASL
jgi:hypothetical protein